MSNRCWPRPLPPYYERAKAMFDQGISLRAISKAIGRSRQQIKHTIDPEARAKALAAKKIRRLRGQS